MNRNTHGAYDPDDLPARMAEKITVTPAGCWQWTGAVQSKGYGSIGQGGRSFLTHRVAYELLVEQIPAHLQIDHLCRNKRCCNPLHLEPVTAQVNCSRTPRARKTHCVNGHPLSGDNLVLKSRRNGRVIRNCRACQRADGLRYRERNGQARRYNVAHRYEQVAS